MRRLGIRRRLADYNDFAQAHGYITRSEIMRMGEISMPQSSADIKMLIEDYPSLGLTYDKSAKFYVTSCQCEQCIQGRQKRKI